MSENKIDLSQYHNALSRKHQMTRFAMACGVPVITTKYCPWEILNRTHTGWCIDLRVDNLTDTLRQAMDMNADELYEMGQKASLLVSEKFDYRSVAKKTMEMYKLIIDYSRRYLPAGGRGE